MPKSTIKRIYKTNKSNVIAIIRYPTKKYGIQYSSLNQDGKVIHQATINGFSSLREAKRELKKTRKKTRPGFLTRNQKEKILADNYMLQSTE